MGFVAPLPLFFFCFFFKSMPCTYNGAMHPTVVCCNPVAVIKAVCQILGASRHMGELHFPFSFELKHGHVTYAS